MAHKASPDPSGGALRTDTGPDAFFSGSGSGSGSGSDKDPTERTIQALLRETYWLREIIESQLAGLITRMNAGDEAVRLLQRFADRTPTTMDVQNTVERLREVTFKMFDGVKTQILERDAATEKASKDVKSAVDAAFAAAKEAVGEQNKSNALSIDKSEKAFTKQIDGLNDVIKTTAKGVDDKINDIKERITIIESKTSISNPSSAIAIAELKASVARLSSSTDHAGGRQSGMTALWGLIVGGLGLLFGAGAWIAWMLKQI